jgi:hypothetical protein
VLRGDFGTSITTRQPVLGLVLGRLPATLELSIMALVIAVLIGGVMALTGTRCAAPGPRRHRRGQRHGAVGAGFPLGAGADPAVRRAAAGVPHLGPGLAALDLPFVTQFYLFESIFRLRFDLWADIVSHMFMPALALAIPLAAIIGQLLKQSLKETMHLDYVTLARTKGYGENHVILREALPNAILPTLTLIGVQFTFLIGGTVIIERLFSYEGLGNMAIDAVINRDLPLIQGIVILFAADLHRGQPAGRPALRPAQPEAAPCLTDAERSAPGRGAAVAVGGWLGLLVAAGALLAPWIAPQDPLAQDLMLGRCRPSGCRWRRARLLARHRQPRPRCAVAHPPRRADGADGGAGRRALATCLIGATLGPAGRVPARLGRHGHLAAGRHLDGVSAGAVSPSC